ncbi:MAG: hypothetical protein MK135_17465, partial [Polyangiaceae bacterium]|nr:hypothetical protein [Polyangiaceae bacterium]
MSPGRGPRKELRYSFLANKKNLFSIQKITTASVKQNGQQMPGSGMPSTVTMIGETTTTAVKDDGTAERQTSFSSVVPQAPGMPPQMVKQMRDAFKAASNIRLKETLDARGEV